jgi:3-oxoacyl-[acyl-carrier-protein] synthase-1
MNRVVVTGLGFTSSIGNSRGQVLQSLREARSGIEVMPELAALNDRVSLAGTVKDFAFPTTDPLDWTLPPSLQLSRTELRTMSPNSVYAVAAMEEAIRDARLDDSHVSSPRTGIHTASAGSPWLEHGIVESLMKRGPMRTSAPSIVAAMPNGLQLNLAAHYAIKGASLGFSSACASSAHALGFAADLIRSGRQDLMFVVGAEDCHPCSILAFAALRALSSQADPMLAPRAFDIARDGFVVTGGAAVLVLESADHAAARGAISYAEVAGWGQASDGHDVVAPDPTGAGLARAMSAALADANLSPEDIDYVNAHATATAVGDVAEQNPSCQQHQKPYGSRPQPGWRSGGRHLLSRVARRVHAHFRQDHATRSRVRGREHHHASHPGPAACGHE